MKRDKLKIYVLELLLIIILFFALFASSIVTRSVLAIIILIYAVIVKKLLKKRNVNSINKKQVTILMVMFGLIYLGIFYLLGLYFGFVRPKVGLSWWSIGRFIIPLTITVVASEVIRNIFLAQDGKLDISGKKYNISLGLTYISMVMIDLLIYTGVYDLSNMEDFLMAMGFVLFASLSCNLLYNYVTARYGSKGVIIYRLITVLYMYIIPFVPEVYIFFRSFLRMIYPFIMYVIVDNIFGKKHYMASVRERKSEFISNSILLVVMTLLIMLISCQFKYGILVVGSRSMTGTLNVGDGVIFEKYEQQDIEKGQVIIFNYGGVQTIHRVEDIRNVNGQKRYYTKGDANPVADKGYTTDKDIYGLVKLRVKYVGYPTLWFRELFVK